MTSLASPKNDIGFDGSLADWMSELPEDKTQIPLCRLKIPGWLLGH